MPSFIDPAQVDERGDNVPVVNVPAGASGFMEGHAGAIRYRQAVSLGLPLDIVLVNRPSDVLVVSLHGAIGRARSALPRFAYLPMLLETGYSIVSFGDPTLHMSERLELAWFTGPAAVDVHKIVAERVCEAAYVVGAKRVVIIGASGGGFAALQVSACIPDSLAIAFNPHGNIEVSCRRVRIRSPAHVR